MNEHGLTVKNLLASLPCVLADDESIAALAEGVARILAGQDEEIENISIYPHLGDIPEALCDILAKDFDVGWYSYDYTPEVKREQIRSTFRIHKKLGTAAAVKELVKSVFGEGEVLEWFDYGGEPYHFRIQTDTALNEDTYTYIYNMIRLVKSVRSRLDSVQILRNTEACIYAGVEQCMVYWPPAVMDGYAVSRGVEVKTFAGGAAGMVHYSPAVRDGYRIGRTAEQKTYAGAFGGAVVRSEPIFEIKREGGRDYATANEPCGHDE